MSPDPQPLALEDRVNLEDPPRRHSRLLTVLAGVVALAILGGAALAAFGILGDDPRPDDRPPPGATTQPPPDPPVNRPVDRDLAVRTLLDDRARAVLSGDRDAFLGHVDTAQPDFLAAQTLLIDRLAEVRLAGWDYQVVGTGPAIGPARELELPPGSAIVRVRLTYRLEGTTTDTDREQYLTVVPRGGRWLLAGDTDAREAGFETQRDLWDLGRVRVVNGESGVVVGDVRGAGRAAMVRLAAEADVAVKDVDRVWDAEWSRRPVVLLPASQKDMATLIGSDGKGLAQIAAVTTGAFEEGVSRGDRVVVNPTTFATLGPIGRRVVLSHEMTHVATRATSVLPVPIWLSEGFADYVAYEATSLPMAIVAGDVLDDVRDGEGPERLPESADFDAGVGDIAAAYEGAWLACRMISERYGEARLLRFYVAMSDSAGPGWPEETVDVLGVSARRLERQWLNYLADKATA